MHFSARAVAQPLTISSWPQAIKNIASCRACRMTISRDACSLLPLPDFTVFAQHGCGVSGTMARRKRNRGTQLTRCLHRETLYTPHHDRSKAAEIHDARSTANDRRERGEPQGLAAGDWGCPSQHPAIRRRPSIDPTGNGRPVASNYGLVLLTCPVRSLKKSVKARA